MEIELYNIKGDVVGKVNLCEEIFGVPVREGMVHNVITAYLANLRSGTASTKRRGEVSGGGKKPWRQKGTGRARVGSIRSPLRRGGGCVFGPKPRSYRMKVPSKVKIASLLALLSDRFLSGRIRVVDKLDLNEPKTSKLLKILKDLRTKRPLIVLGTLENNVLFSSRNIRGVEVISSSELNAHKVIIHEDILFTLEGIKGLERRIFGDGRS